MIEREVRRLRRAPHSQERALHEKVFAHLYLHVRTHTVASSISVSSPHAHTYTQFASRFVRQNIDQHGSRDDVCDAHDRRLACEALVEARRLRGSPSRPLAYGTRRRQLSRRVPSILGCVILSLVIISPSSSLQYVRWTFVRAKPSLSFLQGTGFRRTSSICHFLLLLKKKQERFASSSPSHAPQSLPFDGRSRVNLPPSFSSHVHIIPPIVFISPTPPPLAFNNIHACVCMTTGPRCRHRRRRGF